jgi:GDPmannose 4,6-dehydratase
VGKSWYSHCRSLRLFKINMYHFHLPPKFLESKNKCLVLGVNGQDGSYLAEVLLKRGYLVVGIGRQDGSKWVKSHPNYFYQKLNLVDTDHFRIFLNELQPKYILHLAAVHGPSGYCYEDEWKNVHLVNTVSVHAILDFLRKNSNLNSALIYASSSKVFSFKSGKVINEDSTRYSNCIYSITKNAATDLIFYYRNKYSINAAVVWTFNHESPRRDSSYFIPKLVNILASCARDKNYKCELGDLNFWCDWGDAAEFMYAISCILEINSSKDYIIATGKMTNASLLAKHLFDRHGLDIERHIVDFNLHSVFSSIEPGYADISRLKTAIGFAPEKSIDEVCEEILEQY